MIIFITGATSGIGKYLTKRFLSDGHTVYGIGRKQSKIDAFLDELSSDLVSRLTLSACDVGDRQMLHATVSDCVKRYGTIDCAVANAGISVASSAGDGFNYDAAIFEKVFKTNVLGAVYLFEAVLPLMKKQKSGQLVGIGSLASYRGLPGAGAYCSSKTALVALMESMRLDLRSSSIDVTIVNPGYIKTPLTDKNRFYMPFLMSLESGGAKIYDAICSRKRIVAFPFPLSLLVRLARMVPVWLYDFCVYRFENKKAIT